MHALTSKPLYLLTTFLFYHHHLSPPSQDLTESACVVVLNCMTLRSPQAIFSSLLEHLQPLAVDKKAKQQIRSTQDRLTHIITHSKKTM